MKDRNLKLKRILRNHRFQGLFLTTQRFLGLMLIVIAVSVATKSSVASEYLQNSSGLCKDSVQEGGDGGNPRGGDGSSKAS